MRIIAGILLLVSGVIFPMGMLAWLNSRLNRTPRPTARQVGLLLTLNGLLPVGLVMVGLGLLSPRMWDTSWVRVAAFAAWLAALVILVALLLSRKRVRSGGSDG